MNIKTIGIIGAGTMGSGIGHVMALSGFDVIMLDVKDEFIQKGMGNIKRGLDKMLEKGNGMPFLNPAPVMKIVEVKKGKNSSDETPAVVKNLTEKIGKVSVESK